MNVCMLIAWGDDRLRLALFYCLLVTAKFCHGLQLFNCCRRRGLKVLYLLLNGVANGNSCMNPSVKMSSEY